MDARWFRARGRALLALDARKLHRPVRDDMQRRQAVDGTRRPELAGEVPITGRAERSVPAGAPAIPSAASVTVAAKVSARASGEHGKSCGSWCSSRRWATLVRLLDQ